MATESGPRILDFRSGAQCRMAFRSAAAVLFLLPALAAAEPPALSPGSRVTGEDAIWLFDSVCLANHPEFLASGSLLDGYGFPRLDAALPRRHKEKPLQVIVLPGRAEIDSGARSCSVMAGGVGFGDIDGKLAPLIASRIGSTERHKDPEITAPHAVWLVQTETLQTKIVLAEYDGASVLAASVTLRPEEGQ